MPAPTRRAASLLLAASVAVGGAGVALAIAQPGDLGDDEEDTATAPDAGAPTTAHDHGGDQAAPTSVTVTEPTATTSGLPAPAPAAPAPAAPAAPAAPGGDSGSGLGESGVATADSVTADTGGESLLGAGLVLGGAAAALRAAGRRRLAG